VLIPVATAWLAGLYDRYVVWSIPAELRGIADAMADEASRRDGTGWVAGFAREHAVFVRLFDAQGVQVLATDPLYGEGRVIKRRAFFGWLADFFYGPEGAPDLLAYDKTLGPAGLRAEMRAALAGTPDETWREPDSGKVMVFYRAVPLAKAGGAAYVTRASRRTVRALYDLRYQLLQLTLVLLVVGTALGAWVGWHIVSPLSKMQRAVRRYLLTGKSASMAADRHDEIGELSRDFDELARRLESRLRQTSQATADLAHDLKSPLSTVAASAELLAAGEELSPARRERIAGAIARAAEHMGSSVQAMLTLARLDESLPSDERRPVALAGLVERVLEAYRKDPRCHGMRFDLEHEGDPRVLAAEPRLEQALRNLVDNAVDFCRGTVLVRVAATDEDAIIEVMDDGPGVSPGNRDKIFTRFFSTQPPDASGEGVPGATDADRAGERRARRSSGTGLGLAIVQTVAQAHGGRLELAETCALGGACFRMVLPVT
jgi:two-component system, OmpR family, sensor histidine kinase ChvG